MTTEVKPLSYYQELASLRHSSRVIRPKADLGESAQIQVAPTYVDFGSIPVGESSPTHQVVLQNIGYVDAIVESVTFSSPLFSTSFETADVILLDEYALLPIVFTPDTVTETPVLSVATITLSNGTEYTINLSGSGN